MTAVAVAVAVGTVCPELLVRPSSPLITSPPPFISLLLHCTALCPTGYGPKVLSFNDSTNTEFALRLVPLGGYVAFPTNVGR